MMDNTLGIYIHVPFCARKCSYCDFASYANCLGELPGYLRKLEDELSRCRDPRTVDSVYIGGGTPSLLSGDQLTHLMHCVKENFQLPPDAEISMEANPGTIDLGKLQAYRAAGVNRLSMGVQAKQERLLSTLGRIHRWDDAQEAVRLARAAGFQNINLDLMYALPGQTTSDFLDTLRAAIALQVEHVSAYSLILEEGTPLTHQVEQGNLTEPSEDVCIEMQRAATRLLSENGYHRYEISNYAKPGFECRHNIRYWTRGDYIGFGAAAHSLSHGVRFWNSRELLYKEREGSETIDEHGAREEQIMLGTRMTRGIPLQGLNPEIVNKLTKLELIQCNKERLWLTERGMELHNYVVGELLEPL